MSDIKAETIELVSIGSLVPHPKNMNTHSDDQITRLCKLIEYQGFRNPLVVQKGTNIIVAGHGRLMAAQKLGLHEVPVIYQEFESEAQLYAYMSSDNAIASWAELDLGMINEEMVNFGPDFDLEMLGIENFLVEPAELDGEYGQKLDFQYKLEIDCGDEDKQKMLQTEIQDRGFKVRVLL